MVAPTDPRRRCGSVVGRIVRAPVAREVGMPPQALLAKAEPGTGCGLAVISMGGTEAAAAPRSADVCGYRRRMDRASPRVKPKLRGVFHEAGFYIAVVLAVPLVASAEPGRARLAAAVFAGCVASCFGASALYHRPTWTPGRRAWLARLDHAGVYLLIAGTYTPVALLVMSSGWATPVLAIVWSGAGAAILLKVFWVRAPKWLAAAIALLLGWVGVAAFSQLLGLGPIGLALLVVGGLLYSAGAIVYARRRPDPIPHVFGYHELFHLLTVAAAASQYAAIAFFVLPRA
jgi:hemolysin III